jgi:hypothetical protein
MNVYSDFTIPAFGHNVTIYTQNTKRAELLGNIQYDFVYEIWHVAERFLTNYKYKTASVLKLCSVFITGGAVIHVSIYLNSRGSLETFKLKGVLEIMNSLL